MGATGSGKTTVSGVHLAIMTRNSPNIPQFINRASGLDLQIGMKSATGVQLGNEFTLDGRAVTLIDTPGFANTSKSDAEILKMIAFSLAAV